jgi:protein-disulfide isomerase
VPGPILFRFRATAAAQSYFTRQDPSSLESHTKMAQNRKTTTKKSATVVTSSKTSRKPFYIGLALVAVLGVAGLSYATTQSAKSRIITLDPSLPPVTSQGYVLGNPNAAVELVEFGDFECPACGSYAELAEADVRARYVNTGKVRFRFIDFPLAGHQNTLNASNAAACADEQGKFWEMHDLIYSTQNEWNGITGIDAAKFDDCLDTRRMLPKVQSHLKLANDRGIASTPTFIIGNKQYQLRNGDQASQVAEWLDAALAAAAPAPAAPKKP